MTEPKNTVELIRGRENIQTAREARDQPCCGPFSDDPCELEDT